MTSDNFRRYDLMLFPVAFFVRDVALWDVKAVHPMLYKVGTDLLAACCWLCLAVIVDAARDRWARRSRSVPLPVLTPGARTEGKD